MKTRIIVAILFALFTVGVMYAQDTPNPNIPPSPNVGTLSLGYVTTTDNEDNALTGNPDGDMDYYLFNDDPLHPIEFNIFINESVITTAQLSILAYDIDWASGEVDQVWVNGNYLGNLSGVNNTWSTSVFNIPPGFIVPGPAGKNLIRIDVDVNNPPPNSSWAVEVDWGQLIINGAGGTANFRYVNLDNGIYCNGQCVQVMEEVDATPSMFVRVETYLIDPGGNSVGQVNRTFTATSGDEPFTESMCLPPNPTPGTWKIRAICYEDATNIQQDLQERTFTVTPVCGAIPTLGEWGLIIFGIALLGVGTVYIMRRRSAKVSV